jgi:hypothetical protein
MTLHHRLRGQSAVEYLVLTAAVAAAIGIGMAGDDSVLRQLLEALRTAYRRFAYAISLP